MSRGRIIRLDELNIMSGYGVELVSFQLVTILELTTKLRKNS